MALKSANITASTLITTGPGEFYGVFVNSQTNGATIDVYDNTSGSGEQLVGTLTTAAGTVGLTLPRLPQAVQHSTGLYVDITGTVDVTVYYDS